MFLLTFSALLQLQEKQKYRKVVVSVSSQTIRLPLLCLNIFNSLSKNYPKSKQA